jgi:predicted phosphodiesterase
MKLLVFSDLHNDFRTASKLVELSNSVDVVVGAGDYCVARRGLAEIIASLSAITKPTVLVPGNSESAEELLQVCRSWKSARVLHGRPHFSASEAVYPLLPLGRGVMTFPKKRPTIY